MGARLEEELLRLADQGGVSHFVELLRGAKRLGFEERCENTYGGSFRYTVAPHLDRKSKVLLGINVAARFAPPYGQLDVWVRHEIAAAYSRTSDETVLAELRRFERVQKGEPKYFLRIGDSVTATRFLTTLEGWHSSSVG